MTMQRFKYTMLGIGVGQLALIVLKVTGLISLDWSSVLLPLEVVSVAAVLVFLYLIVCVVEDIRNGVFTDAYKEDDDNGKE